MASIHNTLRFALLRNNLCTPKRAARFLHKHQVLVNGVQVFSDDVSFNASSDSLSVDGKIIPVKKEIYFMMNKQKGRTCSKSQKDYFGKDQPTVYDDIPSDFIPQEERKSIHTVGRLDHDTEGLLLFTSDGLLSHELSSPLFHVTKTYLVTLEKDFSDEEKNKVSALFKEGIWLPHFRGEHGFKTKSARVVWLSSRECSLEISEGKFHQVKRMFHAVQNEVVTLKRIAMGELMLDEKLKPGECRFLSEEEIRLLLR